jgi:hypothetical protein
MNLNSLLWSLFSIYWFLIMFRSHYYFFLLDRFLFFYIHWLYWCRFLLFNRLLFWNVYLILTLFSILFILITRSMCLVIGLIWMIFVMSFCGLFWFLIYLLNFKVLIFLVLNWILFNNLLYGLLNWLIKWGLILRNLVCLFLYKIFRYLFFLINLLTSIALVLGILVLVQSYLIIPLKPTKVALSLGVYNGVRFLSKKSICWIPLWFYIKRTKLPFKCFLYLCFREILSRLLLNKFLLFLNFMSIYNFRNILLQWLRTLRFLGNWFFSLLVFKYFWLDLSFNFYWLIVMFGILWR